MSGYRVQGAPTAIESNTRGAGMVEGDQLGDTFPGVLSTLQEDPSASKVSNLYYKEAVGSFRQPSYQRSFGAKNLSMPITRFGDSAMVEINPDIFWKGPMMLRTTFVIPYTYHGPDVFVPHLRRAETTNFGSVKNAWVTSGSSSTPYNSLYGGNEFTHWGLEDASITTAQKAAFYIQKAATCNVRPRIFYSCGAAYANLAQLRMNMGGAMSYVLDRYANFVGIMASCGSLVQRAALMRAAGNGTLIPDFVNEKRYGLTHETCEIGQIQQYSADGGAMNSTLVTNSYTNNGGIGYQNGASNIPGPAVEHWIACIKTPQTNFSSGQHTDVRRPIDTRLFSSNFVFEVFTANNLDTFIDSGTGFQPVLGRFPTSTNDWSAGYLSGLHIPQGSALNLWQNTDGLFPCMLYRQLQLPYNTVSSTNLWSSFSLALGASGCSAQYFGVYDADLTGISTIGGPAESYADTYRTMGYTAWPIIAQSAGYQNCYGPSPPPISATNYVTKDTLPTPTYTTIINDLRLANDQLGARQVLETRPDLAVYYPFQHMITQVFFISQLTSSTGSVPFANATPGQSSAFVNTSAGGQGYGGLNEITCRTYLRPPISYEIPLSTQIQIPVNPLTCMYVMVLREKDRMSLGYSSPNTYSPALYWNALELQNMLLTYSAQVLQKYEGLDEYFLQQLHERVHPLVVPFRGGPVCRSDLPLFDPESIQQSCGYPGAWYNAYIYEFCMVDELPFHNEAFFQQTPSFRAEMLNFSFNILPSIRRWNPHDYDFRRNTAIDVTQTSSMTQYTSAWYSYLERLAQWCPGIPGSCVNESSTSSINWNLNNDNLSVVVVYAQNALWQLSPRFSKIIFARGA